MAKFQLWGYEGDAIQRPASAGKSFRFIFLRTLRSFALALFLPLFFMILALDEAFFEHLLVAEPQIGDVG